MIVGKTGKLADMKRIGASLVKKVATGIAGFALVGTLFISLNVLIGPKINKGFLVNTGVFNAGHVVKAKPIPYWCREEPDLPVIKHIRDYLGLTQNDEGTCWFPPQP